MTFLRTRAIAYCSVAVPHKPENQQVCLYITCNYLAIALLLCCLFQHKCCLAIRIFQAFQPNTSRANNLAIQTNCPTHSTLIHDTTTSQIWVTQLAPQHHHYPYICNSTMHILSSTPQCLLDHDHGSNTITMFIVTLLIEPTQVRIHHKRTLSIYTLFKP